MYVTEHARLRLTERLGVEGLDITAALEERQGESGTVAYILAGHPWLVAIAVEGSVETVYFRRSEQDVSASAFGMTRKVVDMRGEW